MSDSEKNDLDGETLSPGADTAEDNLSSSLEETLTDAEHSVFQNLPSITDSVAELAPGKIAHRYALIRPLAEGGMSKIWLANDQLLDREVALKILHAKLFGSDNMRSRFEYEARLTGRLDHPGIVPVYDMGALPDNRRYFAMRRIQGCDLRERLAELLEGSEESYPLQRLLNIFSQICMIVAYAHDRGYIHRDLKPANILVGTFGELYVADWGIAKPHISAGSAVIRLHPVSPGAEAGKLMGTVRYMSPEQVRGETDKLSAKSDCFSLGVILYEIVTGRSPFAGSTVLEFMMAINEGPIRPMDRSPDGQPIPEAISQLCALALSKNPDERPGAREMAEMITRFVDGVEDRKRRLERAAECLREGESERALYNEALVELARQREDLKEEEARLEESPLSAEAVGSGDALQPYRALWGTQQRLKDKQSEAEHHFNRSLQAYHRSLHYQDDQNTHGILADLYWEKYSEALRQGDQATTLYFRNLVQKHDVGIYADRLADDGGLVLDVTPESATVKIERFVESGPLLSAEVVDWTGQSLPTGSYRATIQAEGFRIAHLPFLVEGNQVTLLSVDMVPEDDDAFLYIHGGPARLGGDAGAPNASELEHVHIDPFLLARNPVTVLEYVKFLDDVAADDLDKALGHAPRSPSGKRYIDYDEKEGRFIIPTSDLEGDTWDPNWPVCMVNQLDAIAYCEWRKTLDGRAYRLATEAEWEYAARGVDGRVFPWGNGYDRLISYSSRGMKNEQTATGQRSGPARVDEFPYDVSPFGVRHMGGMVIEWTSTINFAGNAVLRGGGLFSTEAWCRAAARTAHSPESIAVQFGFRLARDL